MIQIKQKSETKKTHTHKPRDIQNVCLRVCLGKISVTEIMNEKIIRKRVTKIVQKRSFV